MTERPRWRVAPAGWNVRIEGEDYARGGAGDACAEASMGATTYVSVSRLRVDPAAIDDLISAFRDRIGGAGRDRVASESLEVAALP